MMLVVFTGQLSLFAQSGWNSERYYAYRGKQTTETTYDKVWNNYYGRYVSVRYCRKLNWYQEYHSGYIYYWRYNSNNGRYQWVSEWKEGSFWYCIWSNWYTC